MTKRRRHGIAAAVAAVALAGGGAAMAGATGDDDATEKPITGQALDRASRAALDHVGEGRVTGTEEGDEEGFYEVEVTRGDGAEVDVHLTRDFEVTATEDDGDAGED